MQDVVTLALPCHTCSQYSQHSDHAVTWSNTKGVDIDTTTCEAYEVMKHRDHRSNQNEGNQESMAVVYEEVDGGDQLGQNRGRLYVSGPGRNTAISSETQEYDEVGPAVGGVSGTHATQGEGKSATGGVAVSTEHAQITHGSQEATYEQM